MLWQNVCKNVKISDMYRYHMHVFVSQTDHYV